MASFQAKLGWKRPRKIKNKNYRTVYTRHVIKNYKQIAKKQKNIVLPSFQANIG